MVQNLGACRIQPKDIGLNLNAERGLIKSLAKCRKQLHTVFEQGDGVASFKAQVRVNEGHGLTLSKHELFVQTLHHWDQQRQRNWNHDPKAPLKNFVVCVKV
jgi:hypothetical protein